MRITQEVRPSAKPASSLALYLACGGSKRGRKGIAESLLMCASAVPEALDVLYLSVLDLVSASLFRLDTLNPEAFPRWPLFM